MGAATMPAAPVEEAEAADWWPLAVDDAPPVVAVAMVVAPEAPEAAAVTVEAWCWVAAAAALEDRRGAAAVQKEVTWFWTVAFSGRPGQLL